MSVSPRMGSSASVRFGVVGVIGLSDVEAEIDRRFLSVVTSCLAVASTVAFTIASAGAHATADAHPSDRRRRVAVVVVAVP